MSILADGDFPNVEMLGLPHTDFPLLRRAVCIDNDWAVVIKNLAMKTPESFAHACWVFSKSLDENAQSLAPANRNRKEEQRFWLRFPTRHLALLAKLSALMTILQNQQIQDFPNINAYRCAITAAYLQAIGNFQVDQFQYLFPQAWKSDSTRRWLHAIVTLSFAGLRRVEEELMLQTPKILSTYSSVSGIPAQRIFTFWLMNVLKSTAMLLEVPFPFDAQECSTISTMKPELANGEDGTLPTLVISI
ncbi:hypothetical protein BDZ89DRAFT_1053168 [Hymenopellis radicata]|nr:hypothetical protein BDZ89DRAFT_1053168 [Hymenopellis radicata]